MYIGNVHQAVLDYLVLSYSAVKLSPRALCNTGRTRAVGGIIYTKRSAEMNNNSYSKSM